MLVQTLTVILSVTFGIIIGIDPSKGSLFSYYISTRNFSLAIFNIINFTTIFAIPAVLISLILLNLNNKLLFLIFSVLVIFHSILKYFFGRILHYSGSLRVEVINIVKWSTVNPIISMDYFLLILYQLFWQYSILTTYILSLIMKLIMFLIYRKYSNNAIKIVCSINYDRVLSIYSILSIILLSIANNLIWT